MQPISTDELGKQIRRDIAENNIQLPTLPEVALKVRDAVESDSASSADIAAMVTSDAALSARLIQVVNSPLYRGRVAIDNVQMAVTRMGLKLVKSLVVSLAMKQIFQATSEALDKAFRAVWHDSVEVASIARVLADNVNGLEPEQAMLAGLVHNIGTLPILTKLDEIYGYNANPQTINHVSQALSPEIGCLILEQWRFTEGLVQVPLECQDLQRDSGSPDYSDLVLVARLQHLAASGKLNGASSMENWPTFPAFGKVGIETEVIVLDMEGPAEQIAEVRNMLQN